MVFTAHSIQLLNGKKTMPWTTPLAETQQCQAIFRTLNRSFPPEIRHTIRIADLGALEGGYAVEAARHGYQVTGFEARGNNFENCEFVKAHLDLPNLAFVKDGVDNIASYGSFDVILCLGLLHQLQTPTSFIKLLGSMTEKIVIMDTHYTHRSFLAGFLNISLSMLTRHEGKNGRWHADSIGNHRSFWLVKNDLLQTLREAGFDSIYEQYDRLENMTGRELRRYDRGLFIGYKSGFRTA